VYQMPIDLDAIPEGLLLGMSVDLKFGEGSYRGTGRLKGPQQRYQEDCHQINQYG
jgi:hypothetical protein